jgi:hypothetical protein
MHGLNHFIVSAQYLFNPSASFLHITLDNPA